METSALRSYIMEAQGVQCVMPNCHLPWTDLAHIRAASLGGSRTPSNLVGMCRVCHANYDQHRPQVQEELMRDRKKTVLDRRTPWSTE